MECGEDAKCLEDRNFGHKREQSRVNGVCIVSVHRWFIHHQMEFHIENVLDCVARFEIVKPKIGENSMGLFLTKLMFVVIDSKNLWNKNASECYSSHFASHGSGIDRSHVKWQKKPSHRSQYVSWNSVNFTIAECPSISGCNRNRIKKKTEWNHNVLNCDSYGYGYRIYWRSSSSPQILDQWIIEFVFY